jgi:hypothetical protein
LSLLGSSETNVESYIRSLGLEPTTDEDGVSTYFVERSGKHLARSKYSVDFGIVSGKVDVVTVVLEY